jgi:hypothetical protein
MKRILIGLMLLALPAALGCESQRFHYTATYDDTYPFPIDQTGAFDSRYYVTPDRVLRGLKIPTDAKVDAVEVEDLAVWVSVFPDNQAPTVMVSGFIVDIGGTYKTFENFPIVLSAPDFILGGLNSLIAEGVQKYREILLGYVSRLNYVACLVKLTGDSYPTAGRRIHAQINLRVRATIKYSRCLSVPGPAFDGEKCTD